MGYLGLVKDKLVSIRFESKYTQFGLRDLASITSESKFQNSKIFRRLAFTRCGSVELIANWREPSYVTLTIQAKECYLILYKQVIFAVVDWCSKLKVYASRIYAVSHVTNPPQPGAKAVLSQDRHHLNPRPRELIY